MNWQVPKIWSDGDVWILGGGPSLAKQFEIPDTVIHNVQSGIKKPSEYSPYLESIHNKHVIGVNVAYLIGDWIDMVFFGDNNYFLHHKESMFRWDGLKVSCAPNSAAYPWVKYLFRDSKKFFGITNNPKAVSWNGNSGAAAINVAVNAGAKRIFLLGFDMNLTDNKQHWHNLYKAKHPKNLPFEKHLKGFPAIKEDAKLMNIQIYNVSPDSAIDSFPKINLKEALCV
jgi:hypothetical protein